MLGGPAFLCYQVSQRLAWTELNAFAKEMDAVRY